MKKLAYQISGILLLVGLSAAPVLAGVVFKSSMLREFDENCGTASINNKGDVKLKINGLTPNTAYECSATCACGSGQFLNEECQTDAKGNLKVTFKGAAARITECVCPAVKVNGNQGCISGFGSLP